MGGFMDTMAGDSVDWKGGGIGMVFAGVELFERREESKYAKDEDGKEDVLYLQPLDDPDGEPRKLWLGKYGLRLAMKNALAEAGVKDRKTGGTWTIKRIEDLPPRDYANGAQQFVAKYAASSALTPDTATNKATAADLVDGF